MDDHATVSPVSDQKSDPSLTAHRMPMELATETIHDMIDSADKLMNSIIDGEPAEAQQKIRDVALAQFEAYLDLMAQAATHARALKP